MTTRASGFFCTIFSAASIPSICGMVMSMSTMSGLMRSYSLMAVSPSPASPATCPPKLSTIRPRFLRAKTESSTIRYWTGCPSLLRLTAANCSMFPPSLFPSHYLVTPRHSVTPRESPKSTLARASYLVSPALRLQGAGQRFQLHHSHGMTALNRRLGHAENHAGLFPLRNRQSARCLDQAQAVRSVFSHSRHQKSQRALPKLFRHTLKHHIGRRTMSVHSRIVTQNRYIPQRQAFQLHVPTARADQHPSRQ